MISNRIWLPRYCDPATLLPMVQRTRLIFARPPLLFQDFVGKAIALLMSDRVRSLDFAYQPERALPCKWKCADESLFGVDLCLFAYTGQYPFDKGLIGGYFNERSLAAAVHHAPINLDFGGSHIGYLPGEGGGRFGHIVRPLHRGELSADCGHLSALIAPFQEVYDDACTNILVSCQEAGEYLLDVPNEFLQPSWSSRSIKLLVDVENLTAGALEYHPERPYTHKPPGRSLFRASRKFLENAAAGGGLPERNAPPVAVGRLLKPPFFHIFDTAAEMGPDGNPVVRLLPYMKYILAAEDAAPLLKAAVVHSNLEYNRMADSIRAPAFRPYAFASFTGVFIDLYDEPSRAYVNLFQPVGMCLKAAGHDRESEFNIAEIHQILDQVEPAEPRLPLDGVLGYRRPAHLLERFTYRPGRRPAHPGDDLHGQSSP